MENYSILLGKVNKIKSPKRKNNNNILKDYKKELKDTSKSKSKKIKIISKKSKRIII